MNASHTSVPIQTDALVLGTLEEYSKTLIRAPDIAVLPYFTFDPLHFLPISRQVLLQLNASVMKPLSQLVCILPSYQINCCPKGNRHIRF